MQLFQRWEVLTESPSSSVEEVTQSLLKNRGLQSKKDQENFLNPKSPLEYSLKELKIDKVQVSKAIKRLKKAHKNREKIIIFGDYDSDGINATAILWETLHKLNFDVMPFIPSRFEDGYGINKSSLERLFSESSEVKLIITVDNGIVANDAVDFASESYVDVIITDHHKKHDILPNAHAIIHTTVTSGSAISWIFAREIEKEFNKSEELVKNNLELAAVGTVSDQLPLIGFNRSIVKYGIENLRKTKRLGLRKLFEISNIDQEKIGTYEINYGIAPRINASGRIASGFDGLRLLCTTDEKRAERLAMDLNKLNLERQDLVRDLVEMAETQVTEERLIVVSHKDFHEGVIGLIASKLVEKFYRPAVVISLGEEVGKASARSIKGFSIVDAINSHRDLIIEGGGHDMAAGFSIYEKQIQLFTKNINKYFKKIVKGDILSPSLEIDNQIDFSLLNWNLLKVLESFEPFGIGNRRPVLLVTNCKTSEIKTVGQDKKHLKFKIKNAKKTMDAIAFGRSEILKDLKESKSIDIAFQLDKNVWNGSESLQLIIKDVRRSNNQPI